jgi:hypothetical protein
MSGVFLGKAAGMDPAKAGSGCANERNLKKQKQKRKTNL